jgi:ABC-type transporter Mla subunit MlaD
LHPALRWLARVACPLWLFACGPPSFELTVTFPGPPPLQVGSLVKYRGVPVGGVVEVGLGQSSPSSPAEVELRVVIDDRDVVLREGDVFDVASDGLLEDAYLRIIPAPEGATPLAPGARVAGRAPLASRVAETTEQALERLGELAREQAELLVDSIAEQIDAETMRPDGPRVPPDADPHDDADPSRAGAP